jgi:hypothetical protein
MPNIHGRYDRLTAHEEANKPHSDPLKPTPAKKRKSAKKKIEEIRKRMK